MLRNIRDSYKLYKNSIENPVDIKTYIEIANGYNQHLMDKVLDGEKVTLPMRFGTLCIMGKKQKIRFDENGNVKGLAPDWVKTKQLWDKNSEAKERKQLVYHTNEHSSTIRYKFLWAKSRVLITNKTLYALRLTRTNKREVNKRVNEGKEYLTF
jgi:hypothetical protein